MLDVGVAGSEDQEWVVNLPVLVSSDLLRLLESGLGFESLSAQALTPVPAFWRRQRDVNLHIGVIFNLPAAF